MGAGVVLVVLWRVVGKKIEIISSIPLLIPQSLDHKALRASFFCEKIMKFPEI